MPTGRLSNAPCGASNRSKPWYSRLCRHGGRDFFTRVKWDDAAVRADVRESVGHHLGEAGAAGSALP
ncbi:hypothetical protein D2L64_25840 [Micromonospora radicis]|uniref:Uncharacterized protein n=1 Tax=Micromonospora radicis TaxID=1894971 RepID=A0A418MN40_9ACTN|nr:hypothetical protein D2L64_25840 [Micromonospora radicis]